MKKCIMRTAANLFMSSIFLIILMSISMAIRPEITIKIPLLTYSNLNQLSSSHSSQTLHSLATSSLARARYLKQEPTTLSTLPLTTNSFGSYLIPLGLGTPPQPIYLELDTGSGLVWTPCGTNYSCLNCSFNHPQTRTFLPNMSSSSERLKCNNPKCWWITTRSRCQHCTPKESRTCSEFCPNYLSGYSNEGSTSGILLLETLKIADQTVNDFLLGCSLSSVHLPVGIAGFGRGSESLPSQMGIKKFSYCLSGNYFNIKLQGNEGDFNGGSHSKRLSYTPFYTIPAFDNSVSKNYYYVSLQDIVIGQVPVRLPQRIPRHDGDGGTVVDSGTGMTFMERPIFNAVVQEIERQIDHNTRIGYMGRVGPCFNFSGKKNVEVPKMVYRFSNGAELELSWLNYLAHGDEKHTFCLTFVTDHAVHISHGPAIILGNFQQQNFYIEYDLKRGRLGFKPQNCDNHRKMILTLQK